MRCASIRECLVLRRAPGSSFRLARSTGNWAILFPLAAGTSERSTTTPGTRRRATASTHWMAPRGRAPAHPLSRGIRDRPRYLNGGDWGAERRAASETRPGGRRGRRGRSRRHDARRRGPGVTKPLACLGLPGARAGRPAGVVRWPNETRDLGLHAVRAGLSEDRVDPFDQLARAERLGD